MASRQAGVTGYATTKERRGREFVDIAYGVGPMTGQYLAWQDKAEARRAEVAQRGSLREGQVHPGTARAVLARLRRSAGAALVRAGERLQGSRHIAPQASDAIPAGGVVNVLRTSRR